LKHSDIVFEQSHHFLRSFHVKAAEGPLAGFPDQGAQLGCASRGQENLSSRDG
jgi:hypothetical protein